MDISPLIVDDDVEYGRDSSYEMSGFRVECWACLFLAEVSAVADASHKRISLVLGAPGAADTYPAPVGYRREEVDSDGETNPSAAVDATLPQTKAHPGLPFRPAQAFFAGMERKGGFDLARGESAGGAGVSTHEPQIASETCESMTVRRSPGVAGALLTRVFGEEHGMQGRNLCLGQDFFVRFNEQPGKHFYQ
jgi:hypothetical protein